MKRAGRTILLVTHDMGVIERLCDRALVLELGNVVDVGEPSRIARRYEELNSRSAAVGSSEVAAT